MRMSLKTARRDATVPVAFIVGAGRSGTTLLYKLLCLHPEVAYISNYENRLTWLPDGIAARSVNWSMEHKLRAWFNQGGNAYFTSRPLLKKAFPTPHEGESVFKACGVPLYPARGELPDDETARRLRGRFERIRRRAGARTFLSKRTANNRRIRYLAAIFPDARYVHIDSEPHMLMGGDKAADCYLQSDARLGVEELEKLLAKRNVKNVGYRTPDVKAKLVNHQADKTEFEMDPGTVDPREAVMVLDQIVPPEIGVLGGSGMTSAFCSMMMKRQRSIVQSGHFFGCIGQMLPAAMGAVVATGKPAMLLDGDASVMMHLAEFETMVRYNMPLMVVVMNNEVLGAEYYKLDAHKMEVRGSQITTPDLGKVAVAFGGRGRMATTIEDLTAAAKEFVAKPGPMMVDLRVSKSVPSIPYRRVHYGRDE